MVGALVVMVVIAFLVSRSPAFINKLTSMPPVTWLIFSVLLLKVESFAPPRTDPTALITVSTALSPPVILSFFLFVAGFYAWFSARGAGRQPSRMLITLVAVLLLLWGILAALKSSLLAGGVLLIALCALRSSPYWWVVGAGVVGWSATWMVGVTMLSQSISGSMPFPPADYLSDSIFGQIDQIVASATLFGTGLTLPLSDSSGSFVLTHLLNQGGWLLAVVVMGLLMVFLITSLIVSLKATHPFASVMALLLWAYLVLMTLASVLGNFGWLAFSGSIPLLSLNIPHGVFAAMLAGLSWYSINRQATDSGAKNHL
ncbi:cell division protein FtsW (lipid II flippase) [Desulfurispira natronophila]|uniref:Cell division protein FtsW (Lipid II flippase) n=2 Tax=Desulfurispira natronophila TaxID=682562 RepID=A0A7W7Y485_9BACT|nr:cell division protein FtsW (lipid II flippase) [Desulfurispira natronophila]